MTRATKSSRAAYRHPRIGEKRQSRKPLRIDRLPVEVKNAIIAARAAGQTWKQTAEAASAKAGQSLSPSTVQRWHDLRIEQPSSRTSDVESSLQNIEKMIKQVLAAVSQ